MKARIKVILHNSKAHILLVVFAILLISPNIFYAQQAPPIHWQRCLGGSDDEQAASIIQIPDGGYVVVGYTESKDGDVVGKQYLKDAWLLKLSPTDSIEHQDCFGGSGDDEFTCVIRTADGGYAISGWTNSTDGDGEVSGKHGSLHTDAWVVKMNSSWQVQWQKCYGGSNDDVANAIVQTSDGGYLITGSTYSLDGDVLGKHQITFNSDMWVVKIDPAGNLQWQKCLGGKGDEFGNSILQTSDGGCIIVGKTNSLGGDVVGLHFDTTLGPNYDPDNDGDVEANEGEGGFDAWVVKLDTLQNIQWQRCYGGIRMDEANSIIHSPEGGYIFAGGTESDDGDVIGNHSKPPSKSIRDGWVVKIDSTNKILWQSCLGGLGIDEAFSVIHTLDGGYAVGGWSNSGDEGLFNHGKYDAWVAKINPFGKLEWQKCYGGKDDDGAASIIQTSDKAFAFTGFTTSKDGDVSGLHLVDTTAAGYDPDHDGDNEATETGENTKDMWVVKLYASAGIHSVAGIQGLAISTYPNPAGKIVTLGYDLPKASAVAITVYNIIGERIRDIQNKEKSGHHEVSLDLSSFSTGSYLIKIEACGTIESTKIEISK